MASNPLEPLEVRDVQELPYPKAEIASACLTAIAASAAQPQYQQALCLSFLSLAQFQEGVGPPVDDAVCAFVRSHRNAIKSGSGQNVKDLARNLVQEATAEKRERHQRLWQMVGKDTQRILEKLPSSCRDRNVSCGRRA